MRKFKGNFMCNVEITTNDEGTTILEGINIVGHQRIPMEIITPLAIADTLVNDLKGLTDLYGLTEVTR
jgi:hypothetical protein